ncbi:2-dehydro-3-deoxy-L-rhamnonate dehydrogenase (NAD(+)) [Hyphomicrobiales bacterium]|nr:2-dehydro-3-deoxy-L-rhamnonate dehydrogenase (NAD(+)) [Hyphomicrobiales bacterium]CAH1667155.1 2-dehydro-3-deoxy-L-rhamnonate dehydrogenase (NAD(+)) [Hyphomicrobiales bacterium]
MTVGAMVAQYDLTGRVAIITGGTGGFGKAIAARLGGCGAIPVLWDLPASLARADDLSHATQAVDVTDAASVEAAAADFAKRFGAPDILVNNAGIVGEVRRTWEIPVEEFRRIVDVNLMGAFHVCRAVVPLMLSKDKAERRGRIINVASIQAKEGMHNAAAYSAAKAGLVALTKSLGKELAEEGILVNAITPAASLTAMSIDAPPERLADILSRIPMRRFLQPDEVAAMIAWLASDECSFSTGAVFDLSGGRATY